MRQALTAKPTANEPDHIPQTVACPDCGGAGWYKERVPYGHPNFGKLLACHCKQAEWAARRSARQQQILARLDDELGSELRFCTFASFDPARGATVQQQKSLAEALDAARRYAAAWRGWLYLWGPCGVGKSHLAAAVAHAGIEAGKRVAYASVPRLLRYIKAGIGDRTSDDRLIALQTVDLLILDDLGAEYHTKAGDFNDQILFELINERYLYSGLTVLTSNLPFTQCQSHPRPRARGVRAR